MTRLLALAVMASTALTATTAFAANERVRGTVTSVSGDTLTVHATSGTDVPVTLTGKTHYLKVERSSLDKVDSGAYIGTATKTVDGKLVALEVVVFPAAMKGAGEGHYGWDSIPDTTTSGGSTMTSSAMTNGTVSAAAPAGGSAMTSSAMTNGTVSSAGKSGGEKQITVTYKGGKQVILVPPTAPIVTFKPGDKAELTSGATVFINGVSTDGKVTANAVAVGTDGVNPPM